MIDAKPRGSTDEQHSVVRTVVLHLLPGILFLAFYVAALPVVRGLGFPSLMAIFLTIVFVFVPFQLGYLLYRVRRDGTPFGEVVRYREPVPKGRFAGLVFSLFAWSALCAVLFAPPLDAFFLENMFFWLPESFLLTEDFSRYPAAVLGVTWVSGLVLNGFVAPVVEELYFRGYLLPRISRLGAWAPLVSTVLFSLYHLFTPWQTVGCVISLLPMVYAVWWTRNIYVGMAVLVLGNVASMILLLPLFFA
jgi:membrane protease YdiL (CAAX protease family)